MGGDRCAPQGEKGFGGFGACGKSVGSGGSALGSDTASGYIQVLGESLNLPLSPAVPYLQTSK